jgi:hypothetical protein
MQLQLTTVKVFQHLHYPSFQNAPKLLIKNIWEPIWARSRFNLHFLYNKFYLLHRKRSYDTLPLVISQPPLILPHSSRHFDITPLLFTKEFSIKLIDMIHKLAVLRYSTSVSLQEFYSAFSSSLIGNTVKITSI